VGYNEYDRLRVDVMVHTLTIYQTIYSMSNLSIHKAALEGKDLEISIRRKLNPRPARLSPKYPL
jgi:hypothetical protein